MTQAEAHAILALTLSVMPRNEDSELVDLPPQAVLPAGWTAAERPDLYHAAARLSRLEQVVCGDG